MELLDVIHADDGKHKYMAIFFMPSQTYKYVKFGALGYEDFTTHRDIKRKERYLLRHELKENWEDPTTPGALSRWILWNKPTLEKSIDDFKKRFNL
jgi:hypothetical protein